MLLKEAVLVLSEFLKTRIFSFVSKARESGFLLHFVVGSVNQWVVSHAHATQCHPCHAPQVSYKYVSDAALSLLQRFLPAAFNVTLTNAVLT